MKKKVLMFLVMVLTLSNAGVITVYAEQSKEYISAEWKKTDSDYGLYVTDVIEYKYRVLTDGTVQYRRWNATKNVWVDPYWIDC